MKHSVVNGLRRRAVDVLTAREADMIRQPDTNQLTFSTRANRVLYSYNYRDYLALHTQWLSQGRTHSGILVSSNQHLRVGDEIRALVSFAASHRPSEIANQLFFLPFL